MQQPETPTKGRAADKFTKTIDYLSARWGLALPKRDELSSPSKVRHEGSVEEQVVARIKFLSFKNEDALELALQAFERQAVLICRGWKYKPNADDDLLPRRGSNTSASLASGIFLRRTATEPTTLTELLGALLDAVKEAAERVKKDLEYVTNNDGSLQVAHSESFPGPTPSAIFALPRPPTDPASRLFSENGFVEAEKHRRIRESLPYRHSKDGMRIHDDTIGDMSISSSDGFNPDNDTLSIMENITTADSSDQLSAQLYPTLAQNPRLSDDEDFLTPPQSPSIVETSTESLIDPQLKDENEKDRCMPYAQQADWMQLPGFTSRKRPFPEAIKPAFPRKASRGETRAQGSIYYVNPLKPTDSLYQVDDPFYNKNYTASTSRLITSPGLSRSSTSFDSVSTATNTINTTSSIAWSGARSFTSDTSFRSDSLAGSFNSKNGSFYNSEITRPIGVPPAVPDSKTTVRSVPNTPRAKKRSGPLQRAATTSNAEAQADDADPMDIDKGGFRRRQDFISELLETPRVGKRRADNSDVEFLSNHPCSLPLLPPLDLAAPSKVPFRQLYEVTRVALFCKLPIDVFSRSLSEKIDDYQKLWSSMVTVANKNKALLPERSSLRAWERAQKGFEDVHLTGDLEFPDRGNSSIFQMSLRPLKVENSYRLARKFGGDRFCIIGMPGIEKLPSYLKIDPPIMRARIVDLLSRTNVFFLGRSWRAFWLKPEFAKKTRSNSKDLYNETKHRVYFFARDGDDFQREGADFEQEGGEYRRCKMELEEMLNWFMPFKNNLNQPCLKYFARLALGVSKTTPTVRFESFEIIRTRDARADAPSVRQLTSQNLENNTRESKAPIMNDGCARISRAAAREIAGILGLTSAPCAYQGRIGGAKGIWFVDALDEVWTQSSRNFWIEITDSQFKFEKHQIDILYPDPARVTFEVHSYSKPLSSASLNFQLMPILAHQGVPQREFQRLLEEDITSKIEELSNATDSILSLRKWNDNNAGSEAVRVEGIQMHGGLPCLRHDKINWLIDHGFKPGSCQLLQELLFKAVSEYCLRVPTRMNIGIGKSTYAFMLADPLAVLEENEIHLGFSTSFRDPKDGWEQVLLHDTDVLVARLPAVLSSDIQKVRAVFKPELQMYRDVVIFSSKGSCSLAEKLSGGDYDGDRAWICWEPALVTPFRNSQVPAVPSLEAYGIEKSSIKVADMIEDPNYVDKFLRHGFHFNLQTNMLGVCTAYHESLCYFGTSIDDPKAIAIAALLGHLVDRAKTGIIFDEANWHQFLKSRNLRPRLDKPAYKNIEKGRATPHLIDQLVFETAKAIRNKALKEFADKFVHVGTWDDDLARPWNSEIEVAKDDPCLDRALTELKAACDSIHAFWAANAQPEDSNEGRILQNPLHKPRPQLSFAALVEKCREDFLNIAPTMPSETNPSSTLGRWAREWQHGRSTNWNLVKASYLFHKYHMSRFIWYTAGVELGEIKVIARGRGTYRTTVSGIFNALKLDRKFVDRARRRELEREEAYDFGDEDDEYGAWAFEE